MKYEIDLNTFDIPKDIIMIQADKNKHLSKKLKKDDGSEVDLILGIGQEQLQDAIKSNKTCVDGLVVKLPRDRSSQGLKIDLKEGDHVYCSYFLTEEDDKFVIDGKDCWGLSYVMDFVTYFSTNVFCKIVGGKIKMIADWNFLQPVKQELQKGSIHLNQAWTEALHAANSGGLTKAVLCHISKESKEMGLKVGDIVYFKDRDRYKIFVEGEEYFRVSSRDLMVLETA